MLWCLNKNWSGSPSITALQRPYDFAPVRFSNFLLHGSMESLCCLTSGISRARLLPRRLMLLLDVPSTGRAIQLSNINPAVVEREGSRLARRVLDANDAGVLVGRVLDDIEPVVCPMLARPFELRVR